MSEDIEVWRQRVFTELEISCRQCGRMSPTVWSKKHEENKLSFWRSVLHECTLCSEEYELRQRLDRLTGKDMYALHRCVRDRTKEAKIRKRIEDRKNRIYKKIRKLKMTKEQYKRFLEEAKREEAIKKHGPVLDFTTFFQSEKE